MKKLTQIVGTLRVFFSLLWVGLGVFALVYGVRGFDWVADLLDRNISGVTTNIEVINNLVTVVAAPSWRLPPGWLPMIYPRPWKMSSSPCLP
jgi:hypothetical protein